MTDRKKLDLGPISEVNLKEEGGVYTVTLVRNLPHAREKVWQVLTDPLHLREWSPFTSDRNLGEKGRATLTMADAGNTESFAATVHIADPPSVLEYNWDDDLLRWELEATPTGTRLTLRHSMKDKSFLAGVTAGWHICLVVADLFMQGKPFGPVIGAEASRHGWNELNETYAAKLGVPKMMSPFGRKIIHFMHVSLDGFVATAEGGMDWINVDDEIFDYIGDRTNDGDTALYGRVTYQMMDGYWPTAGDQPNASKHDIDHSRWYNKIQKVVISRSLKGLDKPKVQVVSENLAAAIQALKAKPGKDILIFGSPGAGHSLAAEDLIDEYWLFVNPVLLGSGVPLFKHVEAKRALRLLGSHPFKSGVVCVNYERLR